MSNKELTEELHKAITRKFEKRKLNSAFIDNIWGADLADMQLKSRFNKRIQFLLCFNDIFSKYSWFIPLKDENRTTIANVLQKSLNESNHKPNKIWVDKGSDFHNSQLNYG